MDLFFEITVVLKSHIKGKNQEADPSRVHGS